MPCNTLNKKNLFLRPVAIHNKIRLGPNEDGGYILYERSLEKTDILSKGNINPYIILWDLYSEIMKRGYDSIYKNTLLQLKDKIGNNEIIAIVARI